MESNNQNPSVTIISALSTLSNPQLSDLTRFLSSDRLLYHHRCFALLRSSTRFTYTLQLLQTLSLHQKSLLIARYLLTTLKKITRPWETNTTSSTTRLKEADADAVLLLMLLCEVRQHDSKALEIPPTHWRDVLRDYVFTNMLTVTLTGIGVSSGTILSPYIDVATRCQRFVDGMGCGGGKAKREVAASVSAVVALPSVEVSSGECVICREQMKEGRDVCELPCQHLFHWICVLPWLKKRNTCPCCRFQLPTDDVLGEIERLWGVLVKKGRNGILSTNDETIDKPI